MTSEKPHILLVDDQYARSELIRQRFLRCAGLGGTEGRYNVAFCSGQENGRNSVEVVLSRIRDGWPPGPDRAFWSLVLLDVRFDGTPSDPGDAEFGFNILRALRAAQELRQVPVVMLTEREDVRNEAGRLADGFLPKNDLESDGTAILDGRIWRHGLVPDDRPLGQRLMGRSFAFLDALRKARLYALDQLGSLIFFGETGTGKTEFARYVHHWSRRQGPFLKWTAESKEPGIAKAELFGFWRGGHSQADRSEPGAMERAHGGTFFLDEVAYLSPDIQGLLIEARRRDERGLRTISRMGAMPTANSRQESVRQARDSVLGELDNGGKIKVDVLFVSATNVDLWKERERKDRAFRVDLLNDLGAPLVLPSLNELRADIPQLFAEFVELAAARQISRIDRDRRRVQVDASVHEYLRSLDWRDRNIVTLKAIAEAAVSAVGVDFDVVTMRHVADAIRRLGVQRNDAEVLVSGTKAPIGPGSEQAPTPEPGEEPAPLVALASIIAQIAELQIPADQSLLHGVLPRLQEAYARLCLRLLRAALLATKRSGGTSTLEAVRLLLGRPELRPRGRGDATKAYDVVKRLILFGDTTFTRRGARGCPILTDDEMVKEHITQAIKR